MAAIRLLAACEPTERETVAEVLASYARDPEHPSRLRERAEMRLGEMFCYHVFGDLISAVDRLPYQDRLLTEGWEAVVDNVRRRHEAGPEAAPDAGPDEATEIPAEIAPEGGAQTATDGPVPD